MSESDIVGIVRKVIGYSKTPDEDGEYLAKVKYQLKPISISNLRKIFHVDPHDPDQGIADLIDPLDIDEQKALTLQPYVIDGHLDLEKYDFELRSYQAPGFEEYWKNQK